MTAGAHALVLLALLAWGGLPGSARAFAFTFADETFGVDVIQHPQGYTGTQSLLTITVGIDPSSAHAAAMRIPVHNAVVTLNALTPTVGNLDFTSNVPPNAVDFESVVLHELGHALGLNHPNLASESGVSQPAQDSTRTTDGANNVFDINFWTDGIPGSRDDLRLDDVNLHWFHIVDNNPFAIVQPIDRTTYCRGCALPAGDNAAANASRDVGALLGFPNTEAVLQQGTFTGEAQRTLAPDDVAGLRYAMTGLDETAGTADDYQIQLVFAGLDAASDIVIRFDDASTSFAATSFSSAPISGTHRRVVAPVISFNGQFQWLFNNVMVCGPGEDSDGDGICDDGDASGVAGDSPCTTGSAVGCDDNCPFQPNPGQADQGGRNSPLPDGIGDACQCGDADGDGIVDITDLVGLLRFLGGLPPGVDPTTCSVVGDPACDITDAVVLERFLGGLPPGIAQACAAALP
ncbi:MAG: matrixin family metalloprotease [Myxococcota bacterium]